MVKQIEGIKIAEKSESAKVAQIVKPTAEVKKEAVDAMIQKFKPEPPKSAEQRIQSMKVFEELSKRYSLLVTKDQELKEFIAGNDKNGTSIKFKNAQGFELVVSNSNIIDRLCKGAKEELTILLNEAENEILTFEF